MKKKEFEEQVEEFIEQLDLSIAEQEKLGSFLISIGYTQFFRGADIEIMEILEGEESCQSPAAVTLFGQLLVLIGYIILWSVANQRLKARALSNNCTEEHFCLSPYVKIANAYLLSIIANAIRFEAFSEILYLEG